ncbi:MAG: response regulator transcription factor [Parasporobacterium sp.]|nr:response regulator transcription factor [Parasporobacterium sp.]
MKILLAEDDKDMARAVSALLTRSHYTVDVADNGRDALDCILLGDYDAAVMDIMMPRMDGITVLKEIRRRGNNIPVIMLTAMGEVNDRINGLDSGADDYLPKPFNGGELLSRVKALLRRKDNFEPDIISCGNITLDRNTYILSCGDKHVSLGNKVFQMMEMFIRSPHRVISVNEFMEHIWGWDSEAEINVVWVNISYLRKQLKDLEANVQIRVIRGVGYTLEEI